MHFTNSHCCWIPCKSFFLHTHKHRQILRMSMKKTLTNSYFSFEFPFSIWPKMENRKGVPTTEFNVITTNHTKSLFLIISLQSIALIHNFIIQMNGTHQHVQRNTQLDEIIAFFRPHSGWNIPNGSGKYQETFTLSHRFFFFFLFSTDESFLCRLITLMSHFSKFTI